jgi:hypothetical protein
MFCNVTPSLITVAERSVIAKTTTALLNQSSILKLQIFDTVLYCRIYGSSQVNFSSNFLVDMRNCGYTVLYINMRGAV